MAADRLQLTMLLKVAFNVRNERLVLKALFSKKIAKCQGESELADGKLYLAVPRRKIINFLSKKK